MRGEAKLLGNNAPVAAIDSDSNDLKLLSENADGTRLSIDEGNTEAELLQLLRQQEEQSGHAPGRKLDGKSAPTGKLSTELRYKQAKLLEQAAVMRHWEDSLLRGVGEYKQQILPSRLFYSRARGYPVCVMSVLHYAPEAEQAKMDKEMNVDSQGLTAFDQPVRDWRGNSHMEVLQVSYTVFVNPIRY